MNQENKTIVEPTTEQLREKVIERVKATDDDNLLDFIYKLFIRM